MQNSFTTIAAIAISALGGALLPSPALAITPDSQSITRSIDCGQRNTQDEVEYKGGGVYAQMDGKGGLAVKALPFFNGGDGGYTVYIYQANDRITGYTFGGAFIQNGGPSSDILAIQLSCYNPYL